MKIIKKNMNLIDLHKHYMNNVQNTNNYDLMFSNLQLNITKIVV